MSKKSFTLEDLSKKHPTPGDPPKKPLTLADLSKIMFYPSPKKYKNAESYMDIEDDENIAYSEINDSVPLTFFAPEPYKIGKLPFSHNFVELPSHLNEKSAPSYIKEFVSVVLKIGENDLFKKYIKVTPKFEICKSFCNIKIIGGKHEETEIKLSYYYVTTEYKCYIEFNRLDGCAFVFSLVYHIILLVCDKFLEEKFKCKIEDLESVIKGHNFFHNLD